MTKRRVSSPSRERIELAIEMMATRAMMRRVATKLKKLIEKKR